MTTNLKFTEFVRKPFVVEAVEVTEENIADVAKFIGELEKKDDGTPMIVVDRRIIPNVFRVYPGYFMTRMGDNLRCYSPRIFNDQFREMTEDIRAWVDFMNGVKATASEEDAVAT